MDNSQLRLRPSTTNSYGNHAVGWRSQRYVIQGRNARRHCCRKSSGSTHFPHLAPAAQYTPRGEENRLSAMSELMMFRRNASETIDALLSRFLTLRYRAQNNGAGMTMSLEGYSWLILRACGPKHTINCSTSCSHFRAGSHRPKPSSMHCSFPFGEWAIPSKVPAQILVPS